MKFLTIALGGAAGALLRYLISGLVYRYSKSVFPWGTLTVNLSGAFVIGVLSGLFEFSCMNQQLRLFLFIGVLGAYTTFSTFCLENFYLLRDGEYWPAVVNILISNIAGVLLAAAGFLAAKYILFSFR